MMVVFILCSVFRTSLSHLLKRNSYHIQTSAMDTFDIQNRILCMEAGATSKVHIQYVDGVPHHWFQAKPIVLHLGYCRYNVSQTLNKLSAKHRKSLRELMGADHTPVPPAEYHNYKSMYISEEGLHELVRAAQKRKVTKTRDALYVMQYSFRRDIVKIGRSSNPEKRRVQMESSQAFHVELLATFPEHGELEGKVHEALAAFRNMEGAGQEWFNVTVDHAISVIKSLIPLDESNSSGTGSSV